MIDQFIDKKIHAFICEKFVGVMPIDLKLINYDSQMRQSDDNSGNKQICVYLLGKEGVKTHLKISVSLPGYHVFISFHKDDLWFSFDNYMSHIGKRKEFSRCAAVATFLVTYDVAPMDKAVTTRDFAFDRVPDDQLMKRDVHDIIFIHIRAFSGSAAGIAEGDFTQTPQFPHEIGRVVRGKHIDFIVTVVGVPQEGAVDQFRFKQVFVDRGNDGFHDLELWINELQR